MEWIWLILAGFMEIGWAVGLKHTAGFSKFWPSVFTILTMILSFYFLSLSLKSIPLGTAYAIWTGIGAVGVVLIGMLFFEESRDALRLFCIALIVIGIIGLKIVGSKALGFVSGQPSHHHGSVGSKALGFLSGQPFHFGFSQFALQSLSLIHI